MKFITLILIFTFSICEKLVQELKSDNIDSFMGLNKMGFLMFYSPEDSHSNAIQPIFEDSAKLMREKGYNVTFSQIDAASNQEVLTKFDVTEFPAILWFNNERSQLVPYVGDTEMTSHFLSYVEEQISHETPQISFDQWKNMTEYQKFGSKIDGRNLLIFVGDKNKNLESFNKIVNAAWNVFIREMYWTNDTEFFNYYDLNSELKNSNSTSFEDNIDNVLPFAVLIFKIRNNKTQIDIFEKVDLKLEDLAAEPENKFSSSSLKLENLMRIYSKEIVNIFDHVNERFIVMTIPTLILAHDYQTNSTEYEEMLNNIIKVAQKYRREVFFMIGSPVTKFSQIFTESYRLVASEFPILCFASHSERNSQIVEKYKRILSRDRVPTEEDLIQLIEDWKTTTLRPYISSEPVPQNPQDENGIYKIVGDTFNEVVSQTAKDIVLLFCSDKLDSCKRFKEIFIRVAKKLKDNEKLLFAEINPYTNEVDFHGFSRMPGIVLLPDVENKLEKSIEYKMRLNSRDIIKFIKESVVNKIVNESPLPVESMLIRDEEINEIKPVELDNKGMARKLYEKLTNPDQKNLYKVPDRKLFFETKKNLERKLDMTIQKRISLVKDDL